MKNLYFLILILLTFSSCNKKTIQLPEIQNASITEVVDVSPVYMFYDEETNSIEFNRKNMISTTNWLVNIDERLTLKQVLPHLQYLQEKRHGDGMHKNENARNYFTCNDTIRKNLGFIDFTDAEYHGNNVEVELDPDPNKIIYHLIFKNENDIQIIESNKSSVIINIENLIFELKKVFNENRKLKIIVVTINEDLTFKDYIRFKSILLQLDSPNITISNQEFIY